MESSEIASAGGPIFFVSYLTPLNSSAPWREYESPYGFLSQWYHATFTVPSPSTDARPVTFFTAEQYMMYQKAILFDDQETAAEIALEPEPSKQKALGRKVKGFDNKTWNEKREKIVEDGNWWKFTRSKEADLRDLLLKTGDGLLVEASPYDRIWGVGYSAAKAEANRGNWGENLLGKALMRVRDRLHAEEGKKAEKIGAEENL